MSSKEQRFTSSRVRSSYASVVVSMTLVLFALGLLGVLLVSGRTLGAAVRENFTFTLVLSEEATEADLRTLLKTQQLASYTKSAVLVTKEEAAAELQEELGEEFIQFLGYNPLSNTIDLKLKSEVVANDEWKTLRASLMQEALVTDVLYDPDLIGRVNQNAERLSLLLAGASLVLLIIALALINSSIRLTIYSKRFTLKTMQLVGATSAFIRRPYVRTSLFLGALSALLSILLLVVLGQLMTGYFPQLMALLSGEHLLVVFSGMILMGLLVPGVSTALAIRKYLKLRTNELYY